jgi:predicted Zn-dependent protease
LDIVCDIYGADDRVEQNGKVISLMGSCMPRSIIQVRRIIGRLLGMTIAFICALVLTLQTGWAQSLPPEHIHPIPAILTQAVQRLNPGVEPGDYFDAIERKGVGYLIWSQFPVTVAIDTLGSDRWKSQITAAVVEWQRYFPLKIVSTPETADIRIQAKRLALKPDPKTGKLPRFRSAETHYDVFVSKTSDRSDREIQQRLSHRMTIDLAAGQADGVMLSVARHEIGHAIGLWGHSPNPDDIMYFSQVNKAPLISSRDLRTLHRVYGQPTRLGWAITP